MKLAIIALSLLLLGTSNGAQAACSYDVTPIRTFLNALYADGEYVGPMTSYERNESGEMIRTRRNGGYTIRRPAVDTWEFNGDFCTSTICESSFLQLRIADGCLKSFDTVLNVTTATERRLKYDFVREGLEFERTMSSTNDYRVLSIRDEIWDGKVRMFYSIFKGN